METLVATDQQLQRDTPRTRVTNELGLPEPIVNAIRGDDYSRGDCDFTVTELIKPVRIRALGKKWHDHIVEDASDQIFSLFGRAMHKVLESAADPRYCMVEKRYYADFIMSRNKEYDHQMSANNVADTVFHGEVKRVGGQFDLYDYVLDQEMGVLSDYKLTTRFSTNNGVKPEWTQQLNVNALLLRRNGIPVKSLQIVALFRDWSKMQAARKEDYPQKQVQILKVELWSEEKTEAFIRERIRAHIEGQENPPVCSPEERWRKPDRWALMKKGTKRAVKLYDTQKQAEASLPTGLTKSTYYTEPRPGKDIRCEFYCPVNKYCSYYQELLQEKVA